jgi:hypothetical protein
MQARKRSRSPGNHLITDPADKFIAALVLRMPRMTLGPFKANLMKLSQTIENSPEIGIENGFFS